VCCRACSSGASRWNGPRHGHAPLAPKTCAPLPGRRPCGAPGAPVPNRSHALQTRSLGPRALLTLACRPGAPVANCCGAFPQPPPGTRAWRTRPTLPGAAVLNCRRAFPTRSLGSRARRTRSRPPGSPVVCCLSALPNPRSWLARPGGNLRAGRGGGCRIWVGCAGALARAKKNDPGAHQREASVQSGLLAA
jgi:hypothetical protein